MEAESGTGSAFHVCGSHPPILAETSADSSEIGVNPSPKTQLKLFGNRAESTIKWSLQLVIAWGAGAYISARAARTKIRCLPTTGRDLTNATRGLGRIVS